MKNNKEATLKEWGELLDKMGLNDVSTTKINIARILDSDASRLINEEMNKERYDQIIDEVYENYQWKQPKSFPAHPDSNLSKEEFINKCKVDPEFSEKWGLKVEEKELTLEERYRLVDYDKEKFTSIDEWITWFKNQPDEPYMGVNYTKETTLDTFGVPKKIIRVTYNNETIEVYE